MLVHPLQAFLSDTVDIRETDHLRHHLAGRIESVVFPLQINALGRIRGPLRQLGLDPAPDVDELATGPLLQALEQFGVVELEQARGFLQAGLVEQGLFRVCPYRIHRRADRQRMPFAIEYAAAIGRRGQHAQLPLAALVEQEILPYHLQPGRPPHQADEQQRQ